jgi:hypothetical protein
MAFSTTAASQVALEQVGHFTHQAALADQMVVTETPV